MACAMTGRHTLPHFLQVKERASEGQQCLSQLHVIQVTPGRRLAELRSHELGHVGSLAGENGPPLDIDNE
jgi:folylpolyglutamate synthase/dihydropteroate synthase